MKTTEPIRDRKKIKELINYYRSKGQLRNYVLIVMGVYTALRIGDLLSLQWKDLYDFDQKRFHKTLSIKERKTGKSKTIALNKNVVKALALYKLCKTISPEGYIFASQKTKTKPISRIQAYRIVRAAAKAINIHASCHSLRKTFGYHAWKNGVSLAVIMEIYQHSSFEVTRRYLGISQDDKNEVYIQLDLII
jgi:integrase